MLIPLLSGAFCVLCFVPGFLALHWHEQAVHKQRILDRVLEVLDPTWELVHPWETFRGALRRAYRVAKNTMEETPKITVTYSPLGNWQVRWFGSTSIEHFHVSLRDDLYFCHGFSSLLPWEAVDSAARAYAKQRKDANGELLVIRSIHMPKEPLIDKPENGAMVTLSDFHTQL